MKSKLNNWVLVFLIFAAWLVDDFAVAATDPGLVMAGCGSLTTSSDPNCAKPFQGGVGGDSRLVLLERSDILSITATGVDLVTAITLVTGKSAWFFKGFKQSLKPNWKRAAAPSGQSMYIHKYEYFVFDYSQVQKFNLQRKANGRYVGIHENAKQDVDCFEISGLGVGMELLELERSPGDNGGAFKVILQTPDGELEPKLPQTFLATDYAGTLLAVNNLIFFPTITAGGLSVTAAAAAGGTAIVVTGTNYFAGGVNTGVLRMELVNNSTGAIVPFIAALVVTNTTITTTTPACVAGSYKVQVVTIKGTSELSQQNLIVT